MAKVKKKLKKISAPKKSKKTAKTKLRAKKKVIAKPKAVAKKAKSTPSKTKSGSNQSQDMKPALRQIISPLGDRVVVRLVSSERKTAGGIIIPDTVTDRSGNLQGEVIAVGRGARNKKGHLRPLDLKVGDRILFPEYAGSRIRQGEEDIVILREHEIMGVVQ
ncbi:MAG: co-chaperone GroES [Bdellovibrionaceae bacterium]|nr:co-chaperone GroES [Pseudobdellovibrionaceae bacterium]